jgi:predicted nucleic acid-binding protein
MKRMSFGDAGFFFAVVDANDRWHKECVALLAELKKGGWQLVTTLLVVAETHALLLRRFGSHAAVLWLKHTLPFGRSGKNLAHTKFRPQKKPLLPLPSLPDCLPANKG